jgi:polyphosphate kinase
VAALYKASQAGVRIDLIIRDSCRLRPGIPGLSQNIRVLSLVGRFLEHARLFYFRNQGDEEYFIGSADLMQRNLESRVEVCVPVEAPKLRKQLRQWLDLQLANKRNVWEMQPDGTYVQRRVGGRAGAICVHRKMIDQAEKRLLAVSRNRPPKSMVNKK